jgi:hypothetical protein
MVSPPGSGPGPGVGGATGTKGWFAYAWGLSASLDPQAVTPTAIARQNTIAMMIDSQLRVIFLFMIFVLLSFLIFFSPAIADAFARQCQGLYTV